MKKIILLSVVSFLAIVPACVVLHEAGHYLAGLAFYHTSGSIEFFQHGYAASYTPYANTGALVDYIGGLFAAFILMCAFWILRKRLPIETKLILATVFMANFIYGLFEGLSYQSLINLGFWFLVAGVGSGFFLYVYRKILEVRKLENYAV